MGAAQDAVHKLNVIHKDAAGGHMNMTSGDNSPKELHLLAAPPSAWALLSLSVKCIETQMQAHWLYVITACP